MTHTPSFLPESSTSPVVIHSLTDPDSAIEQPTGIQIFQQLATKLVELLSDVKIIKDVVADLVHAQSYETQFETFSSVTCCFFLAIISTVKQAKINPEIQTSLVQFPKSD